MPGVVYFALDQRKILGYSFTVSEEEEGIPKSGFENGQALLMSLLSTMTLAPFESR